MYRYKQSGAMLLICWGCCTKCPTVKMLISYLLTRVYFHCSFPRHCMNKQQPSRLASVLKLFTAQKIYNIEQQLRDKE